MTAFVEDISRYVSWLSEPLSDAILAIERLREEATREPTTPDAQRIRIEAVHGYLVALRLLHDSARRLADELSGGERDTKPEQVMPKINGKHYRCECGCNVFARTGPSRLECNGCQAKFSTEQ